MAASAGAAEVRRLDRHMIIFFNPLKIFLPLGAALFLAGVVKFIYAK